MATTEQSVAFPAKKSIARAHEAGRALYEERKDHIVKLDVGVYRVPSRSRERHYHLVHTPAFFSRGSKTSRNCSCEIITYSAGKSAYCLHMAAAEIAEEEGCREFRVTERRDAWGTRIHRLEERRAAEGEWRTLVESIERPAVVEEQMWLEDAASEGRA